MYNLSNQKKPKTIHQTKSLFPKKIRQKNLVEPSNTWGGSEEESSSGTRLQSTKLESQSLTIESKFVFFFLSFRSFSEKEGFTLNLQQLTLVWFCVFRLNYNAASGQYRSLIGEFSDQSREMRKGEKHPSKVTQAMDKSTRQLSLRHSYSIVLRLAFTAPPLSDCHK